MNERWIKQKKKGRVCSTEAKTIVLTHDGDEYKKTKGTQKCVIRRTLIWR